MNEFIHLPHFRINDSQILFLAKYVYLDFATKIEIDYPLHKKVLLDEGILIEKRKIEKGEDGEKILILEPHPDDIALSCGGYVLTSLKKGASIKVINLFSRSPLSTFPWRELVSISEEEYESLRLQESFIAIKQYLGLSFKSFKLPLALKRSHLSPFEQLEESDKTLEDYLYGAITEELGMDNYSTLVAPLSVQNHIDHVLSYNVAKKIKQENKNIKLVLYEDMPYSRNQLAFSKKMDELKTQANFQANYILIRDFVDYIADLISIYRSQFDDINRTQMLAIIKEDARKIASEGKSSGEDIENEFYQRVLEVNEIK